MPEHGSTSETGYTGPIHDDVRQMIREALIEHKEERLRRPIGDRCKKLMLALFQEAHERAMDNVHTPIYEVVKQAPGKAIFTGCADELLDEKMHRLAESQDVSQGFVRHLIKSSTFTVPITRFVKQQAKRAVASEAMFELDRSREVPVKKEEKVTPPSPLTGHSPDFSKTSKESKQEKKKEKSSSHHHSKPSTCSKCDSSRHTDDYAMDKHEKEPRGIEVLKPVNVDFIEALDFKNYRLIKQSREYNSLISGRIAKWARKMEIQMKTAVSKPSDPISVPLFLCNFKTASDSSSIHKGAAIWLFPYLIREPAKIALLHRVTADKKSHQQEVKLTTYCQPVNYLLETYATDDFTDEAEAEITNFKQTVGMSTVKYCQALWEKALRCGVVYNEPRLKTISTEGLHPSIRYSMVTYWGANQNATLHNLARHAISLGKLREKTGVFTPLTRDETGSRLKSSKSSRVPFRIITVRTIGEAENSSSSSSSGGQGRAVVSPCVRINSKSP